MEDSEETSAQAPPCLSLGPPCLDINQTSDWPGFRTLLQQLPPQDSDERYCLALGEEELAQLRLFCAQRKQKSLGQGVLCLLPPKPEGHTCEKVGNSSVCCLPVPSLSLSLPLPLALSLLQKGPWGVLLRNGFRIRLGKC